MILIDTGPVIAYLGRNEQHHSWVRQAFRRLAPPFFICDAVFAEICFLLQHRPQGVAHLRTWMRDGFLLHLPLSSVGAQRALALTERHRSVPMSYADASLVVLTETYLDSTVLTLDSAFLIYRRHEDRPLKLSAPFAG